MIDRLLGIVAPHYCYGCHKSGAVLCDDCKYNIIDEPFGRCVVCLGPAGASDLCRGHALPYDKAWVVGERTGVLDNLIDGYKFGHQRSAAAVLAELLDAALPDVPPDIRVVAVPTIAPHIRRRGFDHAQLLARQLAARRQLTQSTVLQRATNSVQFGASKSRRLAQAKRAFVATKRNLSGTYLLVDDVFTTGVTTQYAAAALRAAGADAVWLAVVARQPFDHQGKI